MNSSKVESIAITAVKNEINKYENLLEKLSDRDKQPVWDGHIELYKGDSNKTTDIVGIIPVQVKGRSVSKYENEKDTYFSVKISDIENYRKSNIGAIYFLVKIDCNKNTKIFYKVFDFKNVEQILNENKNQITIRFKFEPLKENELDTICINFIKNLNTYKNIEVLKKTEVYEKSVICYNYNTQYELEEIKKSNKVFYETNAYKEAKEKLENQNVVILHGEPWVGKTTTARRLVQDYIEQGYMFVYGNVDDLTKIKKQVAIDEKIVCLLDDFLGSNVQYLEKNVADSTLDKIVGIFKNSKNKKLIFTTRTYIYNNAKSLFYKFYRSTSLKDEYLIDVTKYTYEEKGNILYNHMKVNNLLGTETHKKIAEDEFYVNIITNDNFNPGVIALICERIKDKNITNVKDYISKALNNPDELWEEEYQKLSEYEKIILIIIVLFGVKVPEEYVREQFEKIIKNENIQLLDSEMFAKSIKILSESFVKITFNNRSEREFEVCKHSIADYIINKIKHRKIDVERYIKSTKFVEPLHYIYLINDRNEVFEELAEKAEKEFDTLENFRYTKESILFNIIEKAMNETRENLLKEIIWNQFKYEDSGIIMNILQNESDVMYDYTINAFKEDVIECGNIDMIFDVRDMYSCETFFKTCAIIFNFQKDTEYMIDYMFEFAEAIADVISDEIESIINEQMTEDIAEDILDGEKLEDIIKNEIDSNFWNEIPSLQKLYSRKNINTILKEVHELCDVYVDKEILNDAIDVVKNNKKQDRKPKYYKYKTTDGNQVKAIKDKFEEGIQLDKDKKIDYDYYDLYTTVKRGENWWQNSFFEDQNYNNLSLYKEFLEKSSTGDESVKGFGAEFLEYVLHKKFNVSEKAHEVLKDIAYDSFVDGKIYISSGKMEKYFEKYPNELQELYNTGIIYTKNDKTQFLNTYIYLYIAVNELLKRKSNLLQIILDWEEADEDEADNVYFIDQLQHVFYLYSEFARREFNNMVIGMLNCFLNVIERSYEKIGKMRVSRAVVNILETTLYFDVMFDYLGNINKLPMYMLFVEFVTGTNIVDDLCKFDYEIYQKVLYKKCYDNEDYGYNIDFRKMLEDKELRTIGEKLRIWDYIYDVYLQCDKVTEILENDRNIDVFNIGKNYIEDKYFK